MDDNNVELPEGWHNHSGYRAIFTAAVQGICANPHFFGPLLQQSPRAAVEFAREVVAAAIALTPKDKSHD
jgi:hypothetical protein